MQEVLKNVKERCFVDGKWVAALAGETIDVEDPSTEEVIARVPRCRAEDVDRAVGAAQKAFQAREWARMRPLDRGRLLEAIAELTEKHGDELALLESIDNGMPVAHAKQLAIPATIDVFRYMGGWCSKIAGATLPVSFDGREYLGYTRREPVGVVGAITPWNYPLAIGAWKIATALAAGCTVVIKPSEMASLSTLRLAELAAEAGLPDGVLNVVTGYGNEAGNALVEHPRVSKITFTGSTRVGRQIASAAARDFKRVTLELGGKSPSLVFADADLELVGPAAAMAVFFNSGQICFAATRLLVQESVYERVVESVVEVARTLKVGNGRDSDTMLGPLISRAQMERVLGYCERGVSNGARLVTGGRRVHEKGYFVEPTVFADVAPDAELAREEIFGPVVGAMPFRTEEEAVKLANDTAYGLAANIWTRDVKRAHRIAHAIRAGSVWINCHGIVDSALPFGGYRQSGWGREVSEEGVRSFTELKTVCSLLED